MTTLLREPFQDTTSFANWNGVTIVPGGRTGSAAQLNAAGYVRFTFPAGTESDWVTFGCAWWPTVAQTSNNSPVMYLYDRGGGFQNVLYRTPAGGLEFHRRAGSFPYVSLGASAPGVFPLATWSYIEVQARFHDTAGVVIVRVNGTEVINVSGVDTRYESVAGVETTYGRVEVETQGLNTLIDDMYVKVGAGETFDGPITIREARLNRSSERIGFTDPHIGDQNRLTRSSARVALPAPPQKDWYRSARQSVRVAFALPYDEDYQRLAHTSTRIAFQDADIAARLAALEVRLLSNPTGGNLLLGYLHARVLSRPTTGGNLRLGGAQLRILRPFTPPVMRYWDGTAWVARPIKLWTGSVWGSALAVKVWNGTAWVETI